MTRPRCSHCTGTILKCQPHIYPQNLCWEPRSNVALGNCLSEQREVPWGNRHKKKRSDWHSFTTVGVGMVYTLDFKQPYSNPRNRNNS